MFDDIFPNVPSLSSNFQIVFKVSIQDRHSFCSCERKWIRYFRVAMPVDSLYYLELEFIV